MTGVALLIVFVISIPTMGVYAIAFTADWHTPVANQTPARASHSCNAFQTYSFKSISDRTAGSIVAFIGGILNTGVFYCTSESKFDNLSMSDLRIRVMLSPNKLSENLKAITAS